jgi:hypothetical protein
VSVWLLMPRIPEQKYWWQLKAAEEINAASRVVGILQVQVFVRLWMLVFRL